MENDKSSSGDDGKRERKSHKGNVYQSSTARLYQSFSGSCTNEGRLNPLFHFFAFMNMIRRTFSSCTHTHTHLVDVIWHSLSFLFKEISNLKGMSFAFHFMSCMNKRKDKRIHSCWHFCVAWSK